MHNFLIIAALLEVHRQVSYIFVTLVIVHKFQGFLVLFTKAWIITKGLLINYDLWGRWIEKKLPLLLQYPKILMYVAQPITCWTVLICDDRGKSLGQNFDVFHSENLFPKKWPPTGIPMWPPTGIPKRIMITTLICWLLKVIIIEQSLMWLIWFDSSDSIHFDLIHLLEIIYPEARPAIIII